MSTGAAPVAIGDVIGGRYHIEALLGQGGMAVVYQARHTATGKSCALKLVHPHLVTRKELVDLFVREAQVGARIGSNPHIVDVFDAGVDEARRIPFIAMELLQGETLEDYIDNRGPMPPPLLRAVVEHLADALDQAHRASVIHRDLKPSNLFLTADRRGQPVLKVMDFGIAKILEAEAQRTATQVGTPAYAAPEQMGPTLRRIAEKQGVIIAAGVSPATDVWAMGLLVFEIYTGLPTGHFWNVETLAELPTKVALEDSEPASLRAKERSSLLPPGFDAWLACCLRRNAAERFPTAGQAAAELFRLMERGAQPSALPAVEATRAWTPGLHPSTSSFRESVPVTGPSWPVGAATPPGVALGSSWPQGVATPPAAGVGTPFPGQVFTPPGQAFTPPGQVPLGATPSGISQLATAVAPPTSAPGGHGASYPPGATPPGFMPPAYGPSPTPAGPAGNPTPLAAPLAPGPSPRKNMPLLLAASAGAFVVMAVLGAWGYGRYRASTLQHACKETGQRCEEACAGGHGPSCIRFGFMLEQGAGAPKDEARAAALYRRACKEGEMHGCATLGTFHARGMAGMPRDPVQAMVLFKSACEGGDALGCDQMGRMYEKGEGGVSRDEVRAVELYQKACNAGDLGGCRDLGTMYLAGQGHLPRDEAKAAELFKQACEGGEKTGCNDLGLLVSEGRGGQARDEARASELYRKACEGRNFYACSNLGFLFEAGRGVQRDEARAVALYKQACDGGALVGCNNLARLYESGGGGLLQDETKAAALFKQTCDGGDMLGCTNYGVMCEDGRGGERQDEAKAAGLFKRACDAGDLNGCRNLGDLYRSGRGVPKDETRAVELLRAGCTKGDMYACSMLGWFYENGKGGLPREDRLALDLYKQACQAGDGLGCNNYGLFAEVGRGGLSRDEEVAATAYEKACDAGRRGACANLGWFVFQGRGGQKKDRERGIELLRQGCKGGNPFGCERLRAAGETLE